MHIFVPDHLELSPKMEDILDRLQRVAKTIRHDLIRPQYHFLPPAGWMNDLHGIFFKDGYYHCFYQHNPHSDVWDTMHWGHARSRDFLHWEHLPVALVPNEEIEEEHCYSGSVTFLREGDQEGEPRIFYTSIPKGQDPLHTANQYIVRPIDKDLLRWDIAHDESLVPSTGPDGRKIYDLRDPFVFWHKGRHHMLIAGNYNERKGGDTHIFHLTAANTDLTAWDFQGSMFEHPNPAVINIECPNLFPLDNGQWLLFFSPHDLNEFYIGTLEQDTAPFTFQTAFGGILDHSHSYYAASGFGMPDGRLVIWGWIGGWISGFPQHMGWNGCASLPREVWVEDGVFYQKPIEDIKKLRHHASEYALSFEAQGNEMIEVPACCEIEWKVKNNGARLCGVGMKTNGVPVMDIAIGERGLNINHKQIDSEYALTKEHTFRVFIDHSVIEVFVDDRFAYTAIIAHGAPYIDLNFHSQGGDSAHDITIWKMNSIW